MRVRLGVVVLLLTGAAVIAYLAIDPFADESDPTVSRHLSGTACERLAGLAGQLGEADDGVNQFLLDLGQQAAGISKGRRALADLARGGRNRIPGRGSSGGSTTAASARSATSSATCARRCSADDRDPLDR